MTTGADDNDVRSPDDDSGVDRRKFIQRVGVGAAVAGGAWAAPAIMGSSVAFAAGSGGPGPTVPPTTASTTTTTDPANLLCGTIVWPTPLSNTFTNVDSNITFPIVATGAPSVSLLSVNGSTARPLPANRVGPNPPSVTYPRGVAAGNTAINYRNLRSGTAPVMSDSGTFAGSGGQRGFIIAQNNQNGGNTSFSSIVNYQQVTFTLSTNVYNLRFSIRDFTATTVDPNDTTFDSWLAGGAFNPANPWGRHRDTIGFDVPVALTGGVSPELVAGTGTYANPFRRSAVFGSSGVDSSINVAIPGPVSSFTVRYSTVGGWGSQWIQLSHFEFGNCPPPPPG